MLKIFAGYDDRMPAGFEVFRHSVESRASGPVAVIPLRLDQLRDAGIYWRDTDGRASTPFSLTRFLVPHLCNYEGTALFVDGSDMLLTQDIFRLTVDHVFDLQDYAVMCVQHAYHPKQSDKFYGQQQYVYPCKNWSSVMYFNCAKCHPLTLARVNTMPPAWLHQFEWVGIDRVGALPVEWNWLAGEDEYRWDNHERPPALIHYTLGLPVVPGAAKTEFDNIWYSERHRLVESIVIDPPLDHATTTDSTTAV